jgi:DNA topoisomerase III
MMKVVLAEKPSVAREIAQFLRAGSRQDGYFEGNGYQVTWAYGHLVTLKEPDEYDAALEEMVARYAADPAGAVRTEDGRRQTVAQAVRVVKQLFRAADEIICATDAGREGELIFRYIQTLTGCASKPFRVCGSVRLTTKAIREAFDKLRPGREYDRLYAAARAAARPIGSSG